MQEFYKYQGTGNDFIMIDNRQTQFNKAEDYINSLCTRRFGIGADGLILIEDSNSYDFRMVYFNADGKEGSMCGNGGRCAVRFARDLGIIKASCSFIASDGPHHATIEGDIVTLQMIDVKVWEDVEGDRFINTGSPHLIKIVEDIDKIDVYNEGKKIRYNDFWMNRGGSNINFVQILKPNEINVRTYERGVEDETYSCGTGVTAAALNQFLNNTVVNEVDVTTLGGSLKVKFNFDKKSNTFNSIFLIGPSEFVFKGILS